MLVSEHQYNQDKDEFFRKHKSNFRCHTSGSSAEDYNKTYTFSDGAIWYEVYKLEVEETTVELYGCKIKTQIKLFKTEYFSSEDATSKIFYEPWDVKDRA